MESKKLARTGENIAVSQARIQHTLERFRIVWLFDQEAFCNFVSSGFHSEAVKCAVGSVLVDAGNLPGMDERAADFLGCLVDTQILLCSGVSQVLVNPLALFSQRLQVSGGRGDFVTLPDRDSDERHLIPVPGLDVTVWLPLREEEPKPVCLRVGGLTA